MSGASFQRSNTTVELVNFYRTPMQRYYRRWMLKLFLLLVLAAGVGAAIKYTPIVSDLKKFNSNPTPNAVKTPIPISTTIAPAGGSAAKPITVGQKSTINLSCSGALSLTVTASSNAPNTLTVTAPASSQVISTGTQPSIITYGTSAGVWKLTDVSQGNRAIIHWSPNGANCTQEVPTQ